MKPKQVVKRLIGVLPERARDIITARYGLGKSSLRSTLEAIGKRYGITRERVRQIENYALANIRKSDVFKKEADSFAELEGVVQELGGIIAERDLLGQLGKDASSQNHILFMLVLGEAFSKEKEDDMFHHRWHVDRDLAQKVHDSLRKLYKDLTNDAIIPEADMVSSFLDHLKDVSEQYKNDEILKRWLSMAKTIGKNPLGEWGLMSSSNIRAKGMRDYAFLVLRRHGSPIHFRDVAKLITELFGKRAHVATTHNELIKDSRFMLVGRGLYALSEWGYVSGVVRDVIKKTLEQHGSLTKDEIIDKVLKERYVKENTIIVNLQNQKYFKKDKEGKYSIAS